LSSDGTFEPRSYLRHRYRYAELALYLTTALLGVATLFVVAKRLDTYHLFTETHFEVPTKSAFGNREEISWHEVSRVRLGCSLRETGPRVWYVLVLRDMRQIPVVLTSELRQNLDLYEAIDSRLIDAEIPFAPKLAEGCLDEVSRDWDQDTRSRLRHLMHAPA
jgi:hypothetical protein